MNRVVVKKDKRQLRIRRKKSFVEELCIIKSVFLFGYISLKL